MISTSSLRNGLGGSTGKSARQVGAESFKMLANGKMWKRSTLKLHGHFFFVVTRTIVKLLIMPVCGSPSCSPLLLGKWWTPWCGTSRCRSLETGSLATTGRGTCTQHIHCQLGETGLVFQALCRPLCDQRGHRLICVSKTFLSCCEIDELWRIHKGRNGLRLRYDFVLIVSKSFLS